jgi:PleD family two-component response regulator
MNYFFYFLFLTAGEPLGLEEDNLSLFETQFCTPEVQFIPQEEFVNIESKSKKVIEKLHSNVRSSKSKDVSSVKGKSKADVILVDDDDDFVTQLSKKLLGKRVHKVVIASSPTSSDDFVTQKPNPPTRQDLVFSNKRPSKVAKKLRMDIPKFTPYVFPHLEKAKQLKEEILSKEYLAANGT